MQNDDSWQECKCIYDQYLMGRWLLFFVMILTLWPNTSGFFIGLRLFSWVEHLILFLSSSITKCPTEGLAC
jgi:hypothetical protein